MASYFVRTKEVPPGSGNSYCYVVKEENGEQKQEYVGPTKDIDIQNWNPTSLKEEPPTDYEPGEGMSTDVREVYDQLYEESLDMDNIPESVRPIKYDKSGKHVGIYNDGMSLLVIVPVTDDKFEEIKDANDADEFDVSRLHSHENTVELPNINFNEGRGKELFFLDDSDNPDNKGFNAFNFELLKQASRVENKGSYKNTSLAGNNLEYEKPNQPVLLHSSRYDYLFPPITPEGGTFDDREFRSVLEDKDQG